METRCLYCYLSLDEDERDLPAYARGYHDYCCRKFFGRPEPPILDLTKETIYELAREVIRGHKTVPGVQPKLSLGFEKGDDRPGRFTIVGLWGEYILKPQSTEYPHLPENESVTMHLAQISKINTVEHTLIRLKDGELAYLTKRIDRTRTGKRHMEDMCQLTERLTEHKYKGSYEQIARAIKKYSINPGLDVTNFYELVLFSFLTGNSDMHLKNFSLIRLENGYQLCPAYDLVATQLALHDGEELALTLNAKKSKLNRKDFETAMLTSGLDPKVIENIFEKFRRLVPDWNALIDVSFLPEEMKGEYREMVEEKFRCLKFEV